MKPTRARIIQSVKKLEDLPPFPAIVGELERHLADENVTTAKIARVVEQDSGLAMRFLRIANSALYHSVKQIVSVDQAVTRLGLDEVRRVVVATALIHQFKNHSGEHPELYWQHCMTTAMMTRSLAARLRHQLASFELATTFTAGLLHDIGELALLSLFPEACKERDRLVHEQRIPIREVELNEWGIQHGEVGEILARNWDLPEAMCQVIRFHHQPWGADPQWRPLVHVVHMANFLCNNEGWSRVGELQQAIRDERAWQTVGFSTEDDAWKNLNLEELVAEVREQGEQSRTFVGFAK